MATKTGRLIVDSKTGEMVDEVKEDQIMIALHDPSIEKAEDHNFQRVLRSDCKLNRINELFSCNAALLKDPFGNVLWPKDWSTQVLPPIGKDNWFYIIHERLEPPPQDDLKDAMYTGATVLVLSSVPKECEPIDISTWILFGIAQDYEPLFELKSQIELVEKKRHMLKAKLKQLPSLEADKTGTEQGELRRKLMDAINTHDVRYEQEIIALRKKIARVEKFLRTEPLTLTPLPLDKPHTDETMDEYEKRAETRSWTIQFQGTRGMELMSAALRKRDWNYICLVRTRPVPTAFLEDDQIANGTLSTKEMKLEVNMRNVRLRRLRHGHGEQIQATIEQEEGRTVAPWDEAFHSSFITSTYVGEWSMGEKHGMGKEVTNYGIYTGMFDHGQRQGRAAMVYGRGISVSGTFEPPFQQYKYNPKYREKKIPRSLLNPLAFSNGLEHGEHMRIVFADGAIYEGEMQQGVITGWGKYTSSTGVIEEGYFVNGELQGDHGRRRILDSTGRMVEDQSGRFVQGQLDGVGTLIEKNGDFYEGSFEQGVKSGRGISYFNQRQCKHVGFWFENMMNGRGDVYFKQEEKNEDWDFWYEGSFLQGQTQSRHRHVDLKQVHPDHLPFTTNGKSIEKMPFLTLILPSFLSKREQRRVKNRFRRSQREQAYIQKQEFKYLSLYYQLLDEFYEQWVLKQRQTKQEKELTADEIERLRQERAAALEYAAKRIQYRQEKYDLVTPKRELAAFETYLERVTLSEQLRLDRARMWEMKALTQEIEEATKQ